MLFQSLMTKFCSLSLLAVFVCALSVPALADDEKARLEAATAYEKVQPSEDLLRGMVEELKKNPDLGLTPAEIAQLEAIDAKEMREKTIQTMAKHFTVAELNAMAAFYGTDEGKSITQKMPAYMTDLVPFIQAQVMTTMQKIMADRQAAGQTKP